VRGHEKADKVVRKRGIRGAEQQEAKIEREVSAFKGKKKITSLVSSVRGPGKKTTTKTTLDYYQIRV